LGSNIVEKIKTPISSSVALFMRKCGKYGRTGQTTPDSIIGGMRFAWWITKAIDTH
jgi:hypothetical protein